MGRTTGKGEPQNSLSRERILEAALSLVEQDGAERLSMRRLAQTLDVWPMALYRYFEDKDALLDAIVERAADDVARPDSRRSWRERLRDLLAGAREALVRGGLGERIPRAVETPGMARLTDEGLAILAAAGFSRAEAERAWTALLSYTVGADVLAADESFDFGLDCLLDGLAARVGSRVS